MRIPSALTLPDIQTAFRDVMARTAALAETTPYDWQGRRLIALADGIANQDAATVGQLQAALAALRGEAPDQVPADGPLTQGPIRIGAFAVRGAPAARRGQLFLASDRNYVTWVSTGTAWVYVAGVQSGTLSPDLKPAGLTVNDDGYLFRSTDFDRLYRWLGASSAWQDAPGQQARTISWFAHTLAPSFEAGVGWQLCNGTAGVVYSKTNGATGTITVPDLTTAARFLRAVAGATGGTGGSATTHTHSVDPPSMTSGDSNAASSQFVLGAGSTAAQNPHQHTVDIASFTSGAPSGASGVDALPPFYEARPYLRL